MKIAFFDAKPYDKPSFEKYGAMAGFDIKYFETKLIIPLDGGIVHYQLIS